MVLGLVGLAGCSGAAPRDERAPEPAAAPSSSAASPSGDSPPQVCPDASAPLLTASPVAACEGRFEGFTYAKNNPSNRGTIGSSWLHRTTEGCLVGNDIVLHADGTAIFGAVAGTWSGDEFYFRTETSDRVNEFTRTEALPSK